MLQPVATSLLSPRLQLSRLHCRFLHTPPRSMRALLSLEQEVLLLTRSVSERLLPSLKISSGSNRARAWLLGVVSQRNTSHYHWSKVHCSMSESALLGSPDSSNRAVGPRIPRCSNESDPLRNTSASAD